MSAVPDVPVDAFEARRAAEQRVLMIKSELIQKLAAENPHLYAKDVERVVNTVFGEIADALCEGDRVELRGFGAFSVKHRDARVGRNPRTGEAVQIEEKWTPFFKAGKEMRERLNRSREDRPEQRAKTA